MPSKLMTLSQAVARFTCDGMQYASGAGLPVGADPVVFGRELIRQNRRHLHAIFHATTQQLNLLCAAGAVDKIECGFSGLEGFGFANGLRRAVESGHVLLEDYSNLTMALRFLGGALNWPFVPTTVNVGTDLQLHSAFHPDEYASSQKIPPVIDPFSGREYGALAPLRPDLAVIHVTLADPEGNAIMLGSEWSRFELSRAARRLILVADALVATDCMRQFPNLVRIPGLLVEAVVYWPFSAWPQASPGIHDGDERLSTRILPEPLAVLKAAVALTLSGELYTHVRISAGRALAGFALGGGLGLLFGLLNGSFRKAETLFDSTIQMIRNIPPLALIPLVILWFGIEESAKLFLVSLGVFFPIYINTFHGIRSVDPGLIEMGRAYGLSGWCLYREVILPGALPSILVGVRFSLGFMWVILIVAETISAQAGIGYMTMNAREFLQTDVVLLGILLYALLGKLADWIAKLSERYWLRWHPSYQPVL